MAALHAGALPMSCGMCQHDSRIKEAWGCEKPSQGTVWSDEVEGELYMSCPIKFIPSSVIDWYREYTYMQDFHAGRQYPQQSVRFVAALTTYKTAYSDYSDLARKMRKHGS